VTSRRFVGESPRGDETPSRASSTRALSRAFQLAAEGSTNVNWQLGLIFIVVLVVVMVVVRRRRTPPGPGAS
jgi:hypothetical protein